MQAPDQKLYVANQERAARIAEVAKDEGQSLGTLAAMLIPGGGQQSEACGLANLAMKRVEEETAIAPFHFPIIWTGLSTTNSRRSGNEFF
jgi:hypothetical protein